jgi:myo-inositol-1(or 4)-monophosphatase
MSNDLDIAKKAAREGVRVIKEFKKGGFEVRQKGFHDLITDADIAAEKEILRVIKDSFPEDDILAEESASYDSLSDNRTWIIDPIDGTTNFAHDFPVYCVSVALWVNQKPKAGVVIEVTRDEEFSAVEGEGAWLNGKAIQVSKTKNQRDGFVGTGFPYDDLSLVDSYLGLFKVLMKELQGIRRPGSAAFDLCCVACGRFDGFYEYSLHIWDLAAASLIIKEAGGVVTDWNGGEGWPFGQRMIAGNEHIHGYLLKMIQEHIPVNERENVV